MRSEVLPALDALAADLLQTVAETPAAIITSQALEGYYASAGGILKACELLESSEEQQTAPSLIDHDDEPINLIWSGEQAEYGYFSPAAGWITVPNAQLATFRVNFDKLFLYMLARMDGAHAAPIALVPGLVWEVGEVRLPGRSKRVPVWITRRLADPAVWAQFTEAARIRPAPGLRIVLSSTPADRLPAKIYNGHEFIAVRDVAVSGGLTVDPELLAARIAWGAPQSDEAITMGADGGSVTVRGKRYRFRGVKNRAIIRQLYKAWKSGNPECMTVQLLENAEFLVSVNTLAKAFSPREDWREFIKEENGSCWMFA